MKSQKSQKRKAQKKSTRAKKLKKIKNTTGLLPYQKKRVEKAKKAEQERIINTIADTKATKK